MHSLWWLPLAAQCVFFALCAGFGAVGVGVLLSGFRKPKGEG